MLSFLRAIKFGFQHITRNFALGFATIVITFLALVSISILMTLNDLGEEVITSLEDKIDVTVYLEREIGDDKVEALLAELGTLDEVEAAQYNSPETELAAFKEEFSTDEVILESILELDKNPLPGTITIQAKDVSHYRTIAEFISQPEYDETVESVDFEDNETIMNRMRRISERSQQAGAALVVVFVVISALVIYNTIKVTIINRRKEIEIMKMVGSESWFVWLPFIVESFIYALIAFVFAVGLYYPAFILAEPGLESAFDGFDFDLGKSILDGWVVILLVQAGVALLLSLVSSYVSVRRYLNK